VAVHQGVAEQQAEEPLEGSLSFRAEVEVTVLQTLEL
jgi:hypothetical protein